MNLRPRVIIILILISIIGNEEDFIIPEELDPDIIYMMEIEENRRILEMQNLPYVQVQVPEVLPAVETENRANMCVACLDAESTHALSPCGHKSLCLMCLESLVSERCPICNSIFTSNLRIW